VLDLWIERVVKKQCRGQVLYQRYADDFVVGFEYGPESESFFTALRGRLARFGLKLSESKSGILRFSRCDPKQSKRFTYLGFDYYWGKARSGKRTVRRRSSGQKIKASLQRMKDWLKKNRHQRLRELRIGLNQRLEGHYNYYGVIGNSSALRRYHASVQKLCYKWLNRRSQRRSYNWTGFAQLWQSLGISLPTIRELAVVSEKQSHLTFTCASP
jgi:hypothetical protein